MKTFEYKHFHAKRRIEIIPGLNALGKQGWDTVCREPDDVGTDGYSYLLKREGEGAPVEIRQTITVPPEHLHIVAANADRPLADADAAAAERTIQRLVPRDPPDSRIPWAEAKSLDIQMDHGRGSYVVDGETVSRAAAEYAQKHGHLPEWAGKVSATAH